MELIRYRRDNIPRNSPFFLLPSSDVSVSVSLNGFDGRASGDIGSGGCDELDSADIKDG
jgi:hypothetical protein